MSSIDVLSMCFRSLFKRKLRTFLTILGVVVGTTAIILMISLGLAVNKRFADRLESMGDLTIITLYDYSRWGWSSEQNQGQSEIPKLDDAAMERFEQIPHVVVATPVMQGYLYFKSGKYTMGAQCVGIKPEAMPLLGYTLAEGRFLQEGDQYDVVFGPLAEAFFQNTQIRTFEERYWEAYMGNEITTYVDVFNDKINMSPDYRYLWTQENAEEEYDFDDENAPRPIRPYNINVVGLLERKENDYDWTSLFGIFFDIDVLKELMAAVRKAEQDNSQERGHFSARRDAGDGTTYDVAYVKVTDHKYTKEVFEAIKEMGYDGQYDAQTLENEQENMRTTQILLFVIGAVAFFVAAIGIANTMFMAIYERTREIGVMKVIGAAIKDIKRLFLLESVLIGFFGGIFGVGISLFISHLLNNADVSFFMEMNYYNFYDQPEETEKAVTSLITPWLCGTALGFASLVGLLSGYFPARRAMRLSALSAIRTE